MADVRQDTAADVASTMRPLAERRKGPTILLLTLAGFAATLLLGATGRLPWPSAMASFFAYCVLLELVESMRVRKPYYGAAHLQRRNSLVINVLVIAGGIAVALGQ